MLKLPSSLKWLIAKRAHIDGAIQMAEQYLLKNQHAIEKYQRITKEMPVLKENLASLDRILGLHEIQVNPQFIPAVRGKKRKDGLSYGELTQSIYKRLQMSHGRPVSSKDIADFIAQHRQELGLPPLTSKQLANQLHNRLKNLCAQGKLVRHHPQRTSAYGLWSLSPELIQGIQNQYDDLECIP